MLTQIVVVRSDWSIIAQTKQVLLDPPFPFRPSALVRWVQLDGLISDERYIPEVRMKTI